MSLRAKLILKILETGLIPEKIARFWIRHLCFQAIKRASLGDIEARHAVFRQIIKDLKQGTSLKKRTILDEEIAEMGIDFYQLFLGQSLKHSCSYFPTGAETLDEAEETMHWMAADRARIRDGMKILDLGCGWGSMTFWLAQQYPQAQITSVTSSVRESISIQKRLNELGLKNVHVITSDFDELSLDQKFDRVICIEKFEDLAKLTNWEEKVKSWLNSSGKLFVQSVVHNQLSYYQETVGLEDMPGNCIGRVRLTPSNETILHFQNLFSIEDQWKISGEHYKLTAEKWLANFYENRLEILPIFEKAYGKRMAWIWFQRWKLFFIALQEQYGFDRGQQWLVSQYLFHLK